MLSSDTSVDDLGPYNYKDTFRSQDMTYVRVILNDQNKVHALRAIGQKEIYHLIDSRVADDSASDNLEYRRRLQDCDALLRQISGLCENLDKYQIPYEPLTHAPNVLDGDVCRLAEEWLEPVITDINQHSQFLTQITEDIKRQYEYHQVLLHALDLINSTVPSTVVSRRNVGTLPSSYSDDDLFQFSNAIPLVNLANPSNPQSNSSTGVVHVYGVLPFNMRTVFNTTVSRISRGNALVIWRANTSTSYMNVTTESQDSASLDSTQLYMEPTYSFSVKLPPGSELYKRVIKLCSVVNARIYEVPLTRNPMEIETVISRVQEDTVRQLEVRTQTLHTLMQEYERVVTTNTSGSLTSMESGVRQTQEYNLLHWQALLLQEKSMIYALSCAATGSRNQSAVFVLNGWVPTHRLSDLERSLIDCVAGSDILPPLMQIPDDINRQIREKYHHDHIDADQPCTSANVPVPPTRFDVTPLWISFQKLVDTYGVPFYKEANPGLFTTITFPFMFGVMFGDIFHGGLLLIVGLIGYFIANRSYKQKHPLSPPSTAPDSLVNGSYGRLADVEFDDEDNEHRNAIEYAHEIIPEDDTMAVGQWIMVLFMGFFSMYAGFIYNDCASVPVTIGPSGLKGYGKKLLPVNQREPYWFGIDPAYYHTPQELPFLNSFKMKMSVIIGVIHMTFGLCVGISNHVYRKRYHLLVLESLPRILLMLCTFGYMIAIIMYKWCVHYPNTNDAPSLIQTMINMFLSPGYVEPKMVLYRGQAYVQLFLLLVAGICVPVIFVGEPLYNYFTWKKKYGTPRYDEQGRAAVPLRQSDAHSYDSFPAESDSDHGDAENMSLLRSNSTRRDLDSSTATGNADGTQTTSISASDNSESTNPYDANYSFSSDIIHHGIHSIEFVLGTVSNTASYLRLWALSLAHAQLAQVFWNKILIEYGVRISPLATVVACAVWLGATVGVLMFMDALECFLHALRLHWVEFNSKFYVGNGYAFKPFSVRVNPNNVDKSS